MTTAEFLYLVAGFIAGGLCAYLAEWLTHGRKVDRLDQAIDTIVDRDEAEVQRLLRKARLI